MSTAIQISNQGDEWATHLEARRDLIKRMVAKDTTDDEFEVFMARCIQTGLDPFAQQIHAVSRYDKREKRKVMTIQVSIHGLRLVADRTGNYAPGRAASYDYKGDGSLLSATAYVKKYAHGTWHEVEETAYWDEFAQYFEGDGGVRSLMGLWASKPHVMLAKCAEALALRRAFPAETKGMYTDDEMSQADAPTVIDVTPDAGRSLSSPESRPVTQQATKRVAPVSSIKSSDSAAPGPSQGQAVAGNAPVLASHEQVGQIVSLAAKVGMPLAELRESLHVADLSELGAARADKVIARIRARAEEQDFAPLEQSNEEFTRSEDALTRDSKRDAELRAASRGRG